MDSTPTSSTKSRLNSELTERELHEAFSKCDSSGSGFISIKRLKIVMRALGFEPRQGEIERLTQKMLSNSVARAVNSDAFTAEELAYILEDKMKPNEESELGSVFRLFDVDKKGFISVHDLRRVANELGETIKEDELREMINEADSSQSGHVTLSDFKQVMKKTSLY